MYKNFFKPLVDKLLALILIILFSPIILIISLLILIKIGKPIFFIQSRPTLNEKIFNIYKFRTMTNEKDENGNLLSDELRLKGIGKIIRTLSLDELPQLFNVLKGDMSFIGPRPLLVRYIPYYKETEKKRHSVRPGITGLAQVNGRNFLSWNERFELDVEYSESISLKKDIEIAIKTIGKILLRKDVAEVTNFVMKDLDDERKN